MLHVAFLTLLRALDIDLRHVNHIRYYYYHYYYSADILTALYKVDYKDVLFNGHTCLAMSRLYSLQVIV